MSTEAASTGEPFGRLEQLRLARRILRAEGDALLALAERLGGTFCRAIDLMQRCTGSVIVSGMGKAGLVGQKIAATLASTGTRAHFLHPGEAMHGDLGRIHRDDVVLMLSQSGETAEILRLLPPLAKLGVPMIAVTGRADSTLASAATVTVELGDLKEACPLRLAPSTSTTAMMAVGDALALVASRMTGFREEDFARFHPGGSLGLKLSKVEEVMRPLSECRVAPQNKSIREVFIEVSRPGRRTGAIMLTDEHGALSGIFTDSDLARLFEEDRDDALGAAIGDVMTASPAVVTAGTMLPAAVDVLASRKISELPVVDAAGKPLGMIDITDVLAMLPSEETPSASPPAPHYLTKPAKSPGASTLKTLPFTNPSESERRIDE